MNSSQHLKGNKCGWRNFSHVLYTLLHWRLKHAFCLFKLLCKMFLAPSTQAQGQILFPWQLTWCTTWIVDLLHPSTQVHTQWTLFPSHHATKHLDHLSNLSIEKFQILCTATPHKFVVLKNVWKVKRNYKQHT